MFPQLQGLGSSTTAKKYALGNLNNAKEYLNHPLLGPRLIQLTRAFVSIENKSARLILGTPDDLKNEIVHPSFFVLERRVHIPRRVAEILRDSAARTRYDIA